MRHRHHTLRRTGVSIVVAAACLASFLVAATPAGAQIPAARLFGRVSRTVHNVPLRVRGYINDDRITSGIPCLSMTGSGRYRPEATAQSKAIRALSKYKGETLKPSQASTNQVMWEAAPGPDGTNAPDWTNPNDPIPDPPSPGCRFDILVNDSDPSVPPSIDEVRAYSGQAQRNLNTLIDGRYSACAANWGLPWDPITKKVRRDPTLGEKLWSTVYPDNVGGLWCAWADTNQAFYGQIYFAPQALVPPSAPPECHTPEDVPAR